ncbi:MAG: TonB-dependent receptor [Acidobacteriota bacterium]|nr:TonB-dependent receptor [Acidobacteriota bacterium]
MKHPYFLRSTSLYLLAALMALFGTTLTASGQRITGSIGGTVKDEQGALVNTAKVKATNTDTGFTRTTTVSSDASFLIQYLPVGNYTVEVSAAGFKKYVQQNVVVAVDQNITLGVTLAVGAENQTIEVSTAPPLVETSTAELGRTVSPSEINSLPLVNRNVYAELSLTPGVMANSSSAQSNANGTPNFQLGVPSTQVQVNGGIDGGVPTVSYYLDGGINMTGLRNYGNPLPNPDALQEFRVETSNFAAQYGRMSGAVVTAVTKSGTNQFHGSLFEFNRNTALNAIPWGQTTAQHYRRNMFGGALGGPIQHDKAFFFFSYGGLRQVVGQALSGGILPSAAQRLGDFTAVTTPVYYPGTKTQVVGTNSSPNCGTPTPNCIPASLLDKTAATLMSKYIPLPTNTATNGYAGYFTGPTTQDEYLGKYDGNLTAKDHVAVSFFYLKSTQNAYGNGNIPYSINQSLSRQYNLNVSDVHTVSANTANQTWLTFTRVAGGRVNLPAVGVDDLGSSFTTQGPKSLPQISVSGYFSAGGAFAGPVSDTDFYSVRDLVSTSKGKHQIDFGGELSLEKDMLLGNLLNFGNFSFNTSAPTTTGNALADFISGQVNTMEQDTPYKGFLSNWYWALFLQDNYRVMPRLTLNLGLRWDVQTSPVESQDLTVTFVPGAQSTKVPTAPLGLQFPGDAGIPRGLAPNRYHHISPRLGMAWDPFGDGKTAIRAGAGVFYGSVSANEWNQPSNAQPFAVRQTFNCIASFTNVYGCPASFPNGDPFPYTFNPSSPRFLSNAAVETISKDYQWPYSYQLNAAIQRELPKNISMTVAYVSTLSHDLPYMVDINAPQWATGATTSATSISARRPYRDGGALGQVTYGESNQTASYHSLQISASRPLTHNLMVSGFYVLGHALQSVNESAVGQASAQDFYALWEERGPMDADRRHTSTISAIWKLDYYKGNNFLMKQVVNGWTISPILTFNSGTPFTVVTGSDRNADSYGNDRPNMVAGVSPLLDPHRARSVSRFAWFNKNAFTPNGPGLGIGPGGADGNTPRDSLQAPGYRNVDLGLFREFPLERGMAIQLRGEATNVFNMVSLNAPNGTYSSLQFGWITSAATQRLLQVGARFTF